MGANELRPRGGLLAIRRRGNALAFQDVADSLVAHLMAEVGESPGDSVVAPVAVLGSQPDDEVLQASISRGPTRIIPLLRPIELSCDQPPVPRPRSCRAA